MAKYFDVHPVDPQPRAIGQAVEILRSGGLIAYPTDSCFALGCPLDNPEGKERILRIRHLDDKHHFTLVCADFAQLGQLVHLDNSVFRAIKAATPGPYTFILPATKEVPRRLLHPRRRPSGCASPSTRSSASCCCAPGGADPVEHATPARRRGTDDRGLGDQGPADRVIDAVIDSGECGVEPTTVVDFSES